MDNDHQLVTGGAPSDPVSDYLNGLARGGKRSQRSALRSIAVCLGYRTPYEVPWRNVTAGQIRQIRAQLRTLYEGTTVKRMVSALRGVLQFAQGNPLPPDVQAELKGKEASSGRLVGRALCPDDLIKVLAAARPTPNGQRDAAMVAAMAGSGMRRDSVTKLDIGDWDPANGRFLLRKAKGDKTYYAQMQAAFRPWVERWLEIRLGDPGPLFPRIYRGQMTRSRLSPQAVSDAVEALRVRADVAPFAPHDLRRTFGTAMIDAGVDMSAVAKLMGHEDVKTTMIYDRRSVERLGELVEKAILLPKEQKP